MKTNTFTAILRQCPLRNLQIQLNYVAMAAALFCFIACKKTLENFDDPFKLSSLPGAELSKSTHPNIILIVGDDVGYEVLRCNGGQSYYTPNLDDMAARGRRYTQCHSTPLCSPSRFQLLTGKYNFRNYTLWGHMDPSVNKTIGNMMQDAGYATCYVGKWQLNGFDASVRALGWDDYFICDPGKGDVEGSRYKNPHIYQNGDFLPDSVTLNKYGEDMFR